MQLPGTCLRLAFCKQMLLLFIINKTWASYSRIAIYSELHQLNTSLKDFILQKRLRAERWRRELLLLNELYSIHCQESHYTGNIN